MKIRKKILVILAAAILITGYIFYSTQEIIIPELLHSDETVDVAVASFALSENTAIKAKAKKPDIKKLVKNASISYFIKNLKESKKRVKFLLREFDHYIAEERESKRWDGIYYNITIKVNSEHFDSLIEKIKEVGWELKNFEIKVLDVSEEWVDLKKRIENDKELETKYLELLGKSKAVSDILEIRKEINSIRKDIETKETRLEILNNEINFSVINLELVKKEKMSASETIFIEFKFIPSLKMGVLYFLKVIEGLIVLWPFLITTGIGWAFWKMRLKKNG